MTSFTRIARPGYDRLAYRQDPRPEPGGFPHGGKCVMQVREKTGASFSFFQLACSLTEPCIIEQRKTRESWVVV